jgi:hypothetical protein
VTIAVPETTLDIELGDGDVRITRRTNNQAVVPNTKSRPPRKATSMCHRPMTQIRWHESVADQLH